MITANYFDGRQGLLHAVGLQVQPDGVTLSGAGIRKTFSPQEFWLEEPFRSAPCYLQFADGSHCEIHERDAQQSLLQQLAYKKSRVEQWQDQWLGALLAIALMLGLLFSAHHWGLPWLADKGAAKLPLSAERLLGAAVMNALDQGLFEPSRLSDQRIAQAEHVLRRLRPVSSRVPIRLEVRSAKALGPNAFALPGGTIVLTDQMVIHITGKDGNELTGSLADELSGVLAHEIGHVENRHAIKSLMNDSLLTVLLGSLFGDFSAVVTVAPAVLVQSEYSRKMEAEADAYAIDLLKRRGISPAHLADLFESLEQKNKHDKNDALPAWMQEASEYVSSHPPTPERIARFRQAAEQ